MKIQEAEILIFEGRLENPVLGDQNLAEKLYKDYVLNGISKDRREGKALLVIGWDDESEEEDAKPWDTSSHPLTLLWDADDFLKLRCFDAEDKGENQEDPFPVSFDGGDYFDQAGRDKPAGCDLVRTWCSSITLT